MDATLLLLKPILKDLTELTNNVIEMNKKLIELCVRLHTLMDEEEEKKL